eukprot:6202861-Pleurochrysis_carterae.AAC.1
MGEGVHSQGYVGTCIGEVCERLMSRRINKSACCQFSSRPKKRRAKAPKAVRARPASPAVSSLSARLYKGARHQIFPRKI